MCLSSHGNWICLRSIGRAKKQQRSQLWPCWRCSFAKMLLLASACLDCTSFLFWSFWSWWATDQSPASASDSSSCLRCFSRDQDTATSFEALARQPMVDLQRTLVQLRSAFQCWSDGWIEHFSWLRRVHSKSDRLFPYLPLFVSKSRLFLQV